MGFDGRWVNLVMDCVSSVSYSFVINGDVCGAVTPTRGLRQGDPISPYLFILVADAFSSLLQNKVRERKLHEAKASRKGPEISHLLFADDSLLFTRANRQECQTIVDVLNQYEQASGQKINYEKSEVSFSKGVESKLREDLMHILNMRQVDRHERYLGIPTIVGRSRKAVFGALIDRIWKKLQGWKEKLLSRAGKEILLKSVIQAIPTYLMGVYKIPHSVTDRIHSAMARFLWGSSDGKQKTHWRSWKSTCTLKCLGGMGFRDMNVFNDALLGRQAWRLTKAPNSLLGRVLKAKYYPNNEFLDSSLRLAGSYSWRSIWSSKALVREGVIWRVGDGRSIKLWDDPWIADSKGRFLSSTAIPNLQWVSGIIDKEKRDWRNDIIDGYFNARDRRSILAIPISESDQKDELCWAFSMTGNYTVKSAYMLGKGGDFDTFHQAWVELWKANVIPKVKHFFWRLCTGTLPTRSLLLHRHMIEDAQCSWCGATLETPAHALVDCPRVKDLWSKCKCDQMADWSSYTSICELVASWKSLDSKVKQRGMFLAWCIWGERNRKVFENKITPNEILTHRVFRYVEDLEKYAVRVHKAVNPSPLRSPTKWLAPPCDIVKINTDASLVTEGWVGLGIVARTHEGKVLWTAARRTQAFWAPEIAEAKGILRALKLASGHRDIILESDCKLLIDRLSKGARHSADLDTVLGDILFLCTQFNSVTWSHVRRDGNCVAHCLAKLVPHGVEQIWENSYPNEIAPYVLMDSLSL